MCLVNYLICQFLIFYGESVVLGICNVPGGKLVKAWKIYFLPERKCSYEGNLACVTHYGIGMFCLTGGGRQQIN